MEDEKEKLTVGKVWKGKEIANVRNESITQYVEVDGLNLYFNVPAYDIPDFPVDGTNDEKKKWLNNNNKMKL